MDKDLLEKIEELEKQIKELKDKYGFLRDYKLVSTMFDKLGIEYVEATFDEINNNESLYIVERNAETRIVSIRRKKDEEDLYAQRY